MRDARYLTCSYLHLVFFLRRVEQVNHRISVLKLVLMLYNKFPELTKKPAASVFESFSKWIKEFTQLQVVGEEVRSKEKKNIKERKGKVERKYWNNIILEAFLEYLCLRS